MGHEALAFDLACVECELTLTVDLGQDDWREQLFAFGDAHRKHQQLIVQIPEQARSADERSERTA